MSISLGDIEKADCVSKIVALQADCTKYRILKGDRER